MIIKSHIRGGFRDAAAYLKEQGENEITRLVEISDPQAKNLDEAFRAMWAISDGTKVKKPLHHISINPMKDERLTDKQVLRICERLEERYGYVHGAHQRVIVEHIKDGRQHFHVMWNRVSLKTGKPHYPFKHKMQSKIAAREMEAELGLKKVTSRSQAKIKVRPFKTGRIGHMPHFQAPLVAFHMPRLPTTYVVKQTIQSQPIPMRPLSGGNVSGMCEAQRIDFKAACEGRITWKEYFDKWGDSCGNGGLQL